MAFATIQMTQGAIVGGNSESIAGLDTTTAITLTDAGGAGATSYLWECLSFPGPDSAAPVITDPALEVATLTPAPSLTDGMYVIRLTRDDPGDGVSTDVRFFAVENDDGHSLPSAAVNRNMSNVGGSAAAQDAGWFGREDGSTNFFLDAYLRLRKLREGRYAGLSLETTHTSSLLVTTLFTYGTDEPHQRFVMAAAGTGNFQVDLDLTGATDGALFRMRVTYNAVAGDFIVRNGSGGSAILTLTAPPSGAIDYEIVAIYNGTAWQVFSVGLIDPLLLVKDKEFMMVSGIHENSTDTFLRIGTLRIDPSLFPANAVATWETSFETSDAGNDSEIRLFNVTDVAAVAGSTFTTASTVIDTQSAAVTLPGSLKEYEVQLRLTGSDPAERASCTLARVTLTWA